MKNVSYLSLLVIIFFGCGENKKEVNKVNENKTSQKIEFINSDDIEEIIENRNGKVLFINVWATWCKPCVEEFPHLVRIAEEYRNKNMDFLSLSVDFGSKADSLVADFIARYNNPDFPVYIVAEKSAEKVIGLLDQKWDGSIPATFVYNSQSGQEAFILGSRDYNFFRKSIDSVLNKSISILR